MSSDPLVCYTIGFNFVTSSNQYFPCGGSAGSNGTSSSSSSGGAQSCCYAGDYCMENSICHYTHSVTNGTGYYMAGCTDPTWQDPACPKQCTSEYGADVIYDTTNDEWNCCVSEAGYLNCQQPSDFIVQAPSPDRIETLTQLNTPVPEASLTKIGSISSYLGAISTISGAPASTSAISSSSSEAASSSLSSSSSSSPTQNTAASATATSTPSTSASSSPSSDGGLSGGAIAGIVIGVIAGLALLVIGALFLYRWNKRNNAAIRKHEWSGQHPAEMGEGGPAPPGHVYGHVGDKPAEYAGGYGWGQGQSPGNGPGAVAPGYGAAMGEYHELSSPNEKAREPQELMGSSGREPAELGDGRKSAMDR